MSPRLFMLMFSMLLGACSGIVVDDVPSPAEKKPPVVRPRLSPEERRHLEKRIDTLIELLGSQEYMARERAGRDILEVGSAALEKLQKATASEDIEVAVRAQRLIEKIRLEVTRTRMELHRAVITGNTDTVREIIGRDASFLDVKPGGQTWFLKAAEAGQVKVVELFIGWGIPVDVRDDNGRTPLHFAATGEVVKLLASRGADVNAKDKIGRAPLHRVPKVEVVRALIAAGVDIDATDNDGQTSLHRAVWMDKQEICRELCKRGANVDAKDRFGNTALDIARETGNGEIAEMLRFHGGEAGSVCRDLVYAIEDRDAAKVKNLLGQGADANMKDTEGTSLMHHAVRAGKLDIVKLVAKKGASADALDASGKTLLHYAAGPEVGEFLIEAGCDVNAEDSAGNRPLHEAVLVNRKELVKLLIAKGADVNARGGFGSTPLHLAASFGWTEIAGLLADAGADLNVSDNRGDAPLDRATSQYSEKVAKLLRKRGAKSRRDSLALLNAVEQGNRELAAEYLSGDADVNMKSAYGMAALHIAAARGDKELTKLLIKGGAGLNAPGPFDRTALHEAVFRGNREIVEILVKAKAEINRRDAFDETPLDDADEDDRELIQFLREHGARTAAELSKPEGK